MLGHHVCSWCLSTFVFFFFYLKMPNWFCTWQKLYFSRGNLNYIRQQNKLVKEFVCLICCLTSPSRRSAMFSSELPGSMSFSSPPPWMWRAWLTPAIARIRARRVITAAVSMVWRWRGGQTEGEKVGWANFWNSQVGVLQSKRENHPDRGLVFSLCGVVMIFTGGIMLSGFIYTLRSGGWKPLKSWRNVLL